MVVNELTSDTGAVPAADVASPKVLTEAESGEGGGLAEAAALAPIESDMMSE